MAMCDYRLCDVCGGKAFYDANLNYELGRDRHPPEPYTRIAGQPQAWGYNIDHVGDWAVLCKECAKTHQAVIVPLASRPQEET